MSNFNVEIENQNLRAMAELSEEALLGISGGGYPGSPFVRSMAKRQTWEQFQAKVNGSLLIDKRPSPRGTR